MVSVMPKLSVNKITALAVIDAKPDKKRYSIYDRELRGFGLRVSPKGTKTFFVMKRINGTMTRITIGKYPLITVHEAREKALEILRKIERENQPWYERILATPVDN